jgi:hypothetical protein
MISQMGLKKTNVAKAASLIRHFNFVQKFPVDENARFASMLDGRIVRRYWYTISKIFPR